MVFYEKHNINSEYWKNKMTHWRRKFPVVRAGKVCSLPELW
jgi:hypothetical protein